MQHFGTLIIINGHSFRKLQKFDSICKKTWKIQIFGEEFQKNYKKDNLVLWH